MVPEKEFPRKERETNVASGWRAGKEPHSWLLETSNVRRRGETISEGSVPENPQMLRSTNNNEEWLDQKVGTGVEASCGLDWRDRTSKFGNCAHPSSLGREVRRFPESLSKCRLGAGSKGSPNESKEFEFK